MCLNKLDSSVKVRKKEGWHMPLAAWLKAGLFDYCYDSFNERHRLFESFIERKQCLALLEAHKKRKENNAFKIWGLLVLLRSLRP